MAPQISWAGPEDDPRYCGFVPRTADGNIKRSSAAIAAFKRMWPCPTTKLSTGPCPEFCINHDIPISCGGCDAPHNMSYMRCVDVKKLHDSYERTVYGGNNMSKGCP